MLVINEAPLQQESEACNRYVILTSKVQSMGPGPGPCHLVLLLIGLEVWARSSDMVCTGYVKIPG